MCDPPAANVVAGGTYTYKLYGETASNYEQLEMFINFPQSIFRVISASATYENPAGATNTSPYADACGWNPVPSSPTYRSCIGPDGFTGGKVGGRVVLTYTVLVQSVGTGFLQGLFYDFSGSSYHYNSDFTNTSLGITVVSRWPLNVSTTGGGAVTSNVGGINCGATCSASYDDNTLVTLTATPTAGNVFSGWGGACSGTATTCQVTMNQARSVTATFVTAYTLTTSVTGTGSISSSPAGISCGADCSESYASGTSVTLTATPGVGQQFTGWTGCTAIVGFPNMCTVTMDQARSVTATFAAIIWPLSVSVTGTGTVTSSPSGINCGADCSETYNDGTSVTLTATPGVGQGFTGWGGACSGTSTTCTLSMTAARSVSATFAPLPTYQLDVAVTGSGSVTSSPSGINCGADCLETYVAGTVVTLSQTPASGFEFAGWSGACTGTGPCSVTMDAAKSVTATFTPIQRTLTTNVVGSGSVTSSPAGVDCGLDCSQDYDDGTVVTLSQTPVRVSSSRVGRATARVRVRAR